MINDIKYIIKKIIIGVGIALCIMILKPKIALAEPSSFGVALYGNNNFEYNSTWFKSFIFTLNLDKDFTGDNENVSINFYYRSKTNANYQKYIVFRNKNDNSYLVSIYYGSSLEEVKLTLDDNNNYVWSNSANSTYSNYYLSTKGGLDGVHSQSIHTFTTNNGYIFYGSSNFDSGYYSNLGININYEIIDTNITNLTINDIPYNDYYSSIPSDYEKIDMFNKYAVLFYPKDYRNIPVECTEYKDEVITDEQGNVTIIKNQTCLQEKYKMTFYYDGYFNTGYADLLNMKRIVEPTEQLPFPADDKDYYELPLYLSKDLFNGVITDEQGNVNVIQKSKGGVIFYNNNINQSTDKDGNVTTYYDKGYIYYDSTLFNYIIIDDINSKINENISFIDSDGNTQNTIITQIPTKNETSSSDNDKIHGFFENILNDTKKKLDGLFGFVKLPFDFLNSLINGTCQPLSAPLPHSDKNIVLPCLSGSFSSWLGETPYNFLRFVINGLLVYRIIIALINFTQRNLDPSDMRLEVLDL